MKFLEDFTGSVFQTFKDKEASAGYAKVFESYDEAEFQRLNRLGCGIYFTPNFCKGGRKEANLTTLNCAFADMDVAKEGENISAEEVKMRKAKLSYALEDAKIAPNFIIDTKNGLQPLWLLEQLEPTDENKKLFSLVEQGIIEWGKRFGSKGDQVKDFVRVLRLPGYYHVKGEPYKCTVKTLFPDRVPISQLREAFPFKEPEIIHNKGPVYTEIERLNFQELIIRAFAYVGRVASFDSQKRLVLDGRVTGTHEGKINGGGFLASNSHEPFVGNCITATAMILGVTNKEAYAWIKEQYKLNENVAKVKESLRVEPRSEYSVDQDVAIYTWGTKGLDKALTPLAAGQLNFITGNTGMGKTTFSFSVAMANALLGHKVLYLSLEQDRKGIIDRLARSRAGITKEEWRVRKDISPYKKAIFRQVVDEMSSMKNLILYGFGKDLQPTIENIFTTIEEVSPSLVFIDNFDDIVKDEKMEYQEQNRVVKELKNFAQKASLPINVLHHRNAKKAGDGIGSVRGSGKITDTSWATLKCSREWDVDASAEDNARFIIKHEKDREFGTFNTAIIYWQNGIFSDQYITF